MSKCVRPSDGIRDGQGRCPPHHRRKRPWGMCVVSLAIVACASTRVAHADQALETETARLQEPGHWEAGAAVEFQRSADGRELAFPAFVEVGVCSRLELLLEPVFYSAILPNDGSDARGVGDTELTLTYLVREETCHFPALALAGEVKFPTATEPLIGTGKADYTGYLIASKALGDFDVHINLGYTIIGQPSGSRLNNIFDFALAAEYHLCQRTDLIAEMLGNTSSLPSGESGGESSTTPEAAGGEFVGTLGVRYRLSETWETFAAFSYDNQNALGLRAGFSWRF